MVKWKGIQPERNLPVELYDLSSDEGETADVAGTNIDIVRKLEKMFVRVRTESELWPVK